MQGAFDQPAFARIDRLAVAQQVEIAEDRHQEVVEVVRHAAGQVAHRFHLLALAQRAMGLFAFGDSDLDACLQRFVQRLEVDFRLAARRDVGEQDADMVERRVVDRKGVDLVPAFVQRHGRMLEAHGLAGRGDGAVDVEPVGLVIGRQGAAPLADDIRQAGRGIGFDEAVVDGLAGLVEPHLDDAEADIERVEQAVIAVLAAQGRFLRLADALLVLRLDLPGLGVKAVFEDAPVRGLAGFAGAAFAVEVGQGAAVAQDQPDQGHDGDRDQQGQGAGDAEWAVGRDPHQEEADQRRQGQEGQLPPRGGAGGPGRVDDLGPAADLPRQDGGYRRQQQGQRRVQRHGLEHRNGVEVAGAIGIAEDRDAGDQHGRGRQGVADRAQAGNAPDRQGAGDQQDAERAGG